MGAHDNITQRLMESADARFAKIEYAAREAGNQHPEVKPVLPSIIAAYAAQRSAEKSEIAGFVNSIPAGMAPDMHFVQDRIGAIVDRHGALAVKQAYAANSGPSRALVDKAFSSMHRAANPGMFDGITGQIYDPDKGGFQLGGLIGGALAAIGVATMTGWLSTGWMGWVGAAIVTIAGAWLGNKGADLIGNAMGGPAKPESGQGPSPAQSAGVSQSLGAAPGQTENNKHYEQLVDLGQHKPLPAGHADHNDVQLQPVPDARQSSGSKPAQVM